MNAKNSVFSNFLDPLGSDYAEKSKVSVLYDRLRIAYNQGVKGILDTTRMITLSSEQDEDEIIYLLWSNPDFRKLVNWINRKIVLELNNVDYRAIDVRLRIATGMLNKLSLPKNLSIRIHQNLVNNVRREISILNTEDLPF